MSEFTIVELDDRIEFGLAVIDDELMMHDTAKGCFNSNCVNNICCSTNSSCANTTCGACS